MNTGTVGASTVLLCAGCMLASAFAPVGCVGKDQSEASDAEVSPSLAPADSGSCVAGQLVAAATSTITTPDPSPVGPVLAGSASGDFLAVWTDSDGSGAPAPIWSSFVHPGPAGAVASPAVELTSTGSCAVAASTDMGFSVVWADESGMQLLQLDAQGTPIAAPSQVLAGASTMCPMSLLDTGAGLAVAWSTGQPLSTGESTLTENVALIDATGAMSAPILLDTVGPGVAVDMGLAELGGQTYVAFVEWPDASSDTAVSRIDWSAGAAFPQGTVPEYLQSFVAADGQLWVSTYGGNGWQLYASPPGGQLQPAGQGANSFADLAVDACGQLVGLGSGGFNPGGVADGFYAQSFEGAGSQAMLGAVTEGTLAGAGSTFGVLWFARVGPGAPFDADAHATGALSFTTLSWK